MKIMKITALCTIAVFGAVLMFTACKKDKTTGITTTTTTDTSVNEDTQYADDLARTEQTFDEAQNFADQAADNGTVEMKGGPALLSNCARVIIDTGNSPHKITIDFGSSNCLCRDGRYRRGKIIITFEHRYRDSGYEHAIRFDDYYVNDNNVIGTRTVKNMGHNAAGHTYFDVHIDGMIVLNATGDTIKHTSARVRTWVAGERTPNLADDEYELTGSGTLTRASGKTYSINITSPLHIALNCNWIEKGTVAITPNGASSPRILDYGSGICDDQATITVNGRTRTITLR